MVERKPILIVLDLIENITITPRLISLPLSDHDYHYYHYHHWRGGYELNHWQSIRSQPEYLVSVPWIHSSWETFRSL